MPWVLMICLATDACMSILVLQVNGWEIGQFGERDVIKEAIACLPESHVIRVHRMLSNVWSR